MGGPREHTVVEVLRGAARTALTRIKQREERGGHATMSTNRKSKVDVDRCGLAPAGPVVHMALAAHFSLLFLSLTGR